MGGLCSQWLAEHKTAPRSFIRIVSIIHSENRLTFTHKGNIVGGTRGREFVIEGSSMARGIEVKGQRAIEGVPTSLSETRSLDNVILVSKPYESQISMFP